MIGLTFTVFGVAQPQGSSKAFMPKGARFPVVTSDNPKIKGWRQLVAEAASHALRGRGQLCEGPVMLSIRFYLPRPKSLANKDRAHVTRPDVDKLCRAVSDALTSVAYRDDSQIVGLHAEKRYAGPGESPRAVVIVTPLEVQS